MLRVKNVDKTHQAAWGARQRGAAWSRSDDAGRRRGRACERRQAEAAAGAASHPRWSPRPRRMTPRPTRRCLPATAVGNLPTNITIMLSNRSGDSADDVGMHSLFEEKTYYVAQVSINYKLIRNILFWNI